MRIWIDTDIGTDVDDALTLAYVLRHPGFELAGVSTVFGDVALRSRIAERVIEIAGPLRAPVVTGLGVPISPGRKGRMFGHEGVGILDDPHPELVVEIEEGGDRRIAQLAAAIAKAAPDVLLAIGPLTNLGALVEAGASLPPLAIMGGKLEAVMLEGMIPQISEWNWFCDPVAVQRVLAARADSLPRVVPAEVTFGTELPLPEVERLASGDALAQQLAVLSQEWLRLQREKLGSRRPRVCLHDPLTAAVLVEPDLCEFRMRRIAVDDAGASQPEDGDPNLIAATSVENDALWKHLMEIWIP